jgi:hypothetical protein
VPSKSENASTLALCSCIPTGMHGRTWIFWASLTPSWLKVNMSYLFRGMDEGSGSGPSILLNLTSTPGAGGAVLSAPFTERNIGAYGSAILQINCSGGGQRKAGSSSSAAQLVVNPSFETHLGSG